MVTYFQNLWYFSSENSRSKNSRKFGLFLIEAEVEATSQKWEFGPEKKIKYQFFTVRKSAFMTYGQFPSRNGL